MPNTKVRVPELLGRERIIAPGALPFTQSSEFKDNSRLPEEEEEHDETKEKEGENGEGSLQSC